MKMKNISLTLFLLLLLVAAFLLNVVLGSVKLPLTDVCNAICGSEDISPITRNIIFKSRIPQTLTALVAGAGLAVSGLQMQTVFRNPLAGPTVLGISNGASLGVAFVVLLNGSIGGTALSRMGLMGEAALTFAAIVGALSVMLVILMVARRVQSAVSLLVIGVMIGYVANAMIGVLKFFSIEEDVRTYVVWGLGSFSRVSPEHIPPFLWSMAVLLSLTLLMVKPMNIMLLGDNYARNLGLDVWKSRAMLIASSGVLCAVVTAYCGPIAFLGLAVPHLAQGILGSSDNRVLLPTTMLTGAILALLCNLIARMPGFEGALPVNSVTALVGAPVVCWVLFRGR